MSKRLQKAAEVAKNTMRGDLRDCVLDIIRDPKLSGKAWKDMNETEQRTVADTINNRVHVGVIRAVDIIASEGRRHIKVLLKQATVKDGIKGVFECAKTHELRHDLLDAQGDNVLIVFTGADQYLGQRDKVKITKDQNNLPLNEDEGDDDDEEENVNTETGEIDEEGAVD